MFASPQVITYNAVATDLHRITDDGMSSVYQSADGNQKLTISHQTSKNRTRRLVKYERKVVAADPLTAENTYQQASVHVVIDEPNFGFADADLDNQVDALTLWLNAANIGAVLAGRH